MERVFPIRCTIFEDSPNLLGDHQKAGRYFLPRYATYRTRINASFAYIPSLEINQHRTLLVQSPVYEKGSSSVQLRGQTSPGVDSALLEEGELRDWPSSVAVEEGLETPTPGNPQLVYTERCEYAFADNERPEDGIVSGKREHITRCEDEPIRMPGSIQSHGMLIGLEIVEEQGRPRYECRLVSENSHAICSYTPRFILELDNFIRLFPAYQRPIFQTHARSVVTQFKQTLESAEPKVFNTSFVDPSGCIISAWCAMHFLGGDHNLLMCEFELEAISEVVPDLPDDLASTPFNSLASDPMDATASFISMSEPLKISGGSVDLFQGEGRTMEVVNVMSQIQQQLSDAITIQGLLDAIVGVIKELTSFHRCMVYQFDEEYNGTVVAELVNPQACSDVYRGLHFPASDIPKQARDLYKINRVRVLFDRDLETSRLICKHVKDVDTPVDLTHSYLRAMSPVHLKYLKNMGVKSTMSISLNYNDNLWGLICCHSYGPKGLRVPFPIRELCYWVGLCASNCLDKLLNADKLRSRNSLISMQINVSPQLCISASSDDLLRLFQADFGFLVVQGEARTIGKLSSYPEAVTLLRYVYFRNFSTSYATKAVSQDFSDLAFKPGFAHIAGLLVIPLSHEAGDFIVFFRKNQITEVHWAGNPSMAKIGALEPRNSFKKWTETVKQSSKPWSDEQCTFPHY
jgi:light-regulated signal transduction histidine kinase (bacteriophytochrome)